MTHVLIVLFFMLALAVIAQCVCINKQKKAR